MENFGESKPLIFLVSAKRPLRQSMAKYTSQSFPPCWPPGADGEGGCRMGDRWGKKTVPKNRRHREFRGPGTSEVWGTSITAGLTPHGGRQIRNMGAWYLGGIRLGKVAPGLPKDPMGRYCEKHQICGSLHSSLILIPGWAAETSPQ